MLHHISLPVKNPQHVASVLAEILRGKAVPFPPNPNSYIVVVGDEFGTAIELYPLGSEIVPDAWNGQGGFRVNNNPSVYTAVHAAISVPVSLEEIEHIGVREGWRVFPCNRDGLFDVVEFWLENFLMLELLTPEMRTKYLNAMNVQTMESFAVADARS